MNAPVTSHATYPFLEGGGEAAQLILKHNWAASKLGIPETWPLSLRLNLGTMLHSAFPMFLFWGEDLICFYNDAYRPSLGNDGKHPCIGRKGIEVWPEIWDFIGPLIQQVMETGKPVFHEDQLLPIYRNGQMEDVYWTFSYSPAYGDESNICGVLVTCMETTKTVLTHKKEEDTIAQRTEELAEAHRSLLKANQYLHTLINHFKEPMQVLEPIWEGEEIVDFYYRLTNEAYAAYANMKSADLKDKKVSEFFPGYLDTSSFHNNAEVFKTGIPNTWDIHYNVDGLELYNRMSAMRLENELIVHFTDFTELKLLQNELVSKIEELERSNQQLEEFAHAASHDLKEPARKIQVFTAMLKRQLSEQLQETERDTFDRIEKASQRMGLLIDDLLTYTHVSQNPIQQETVDLNETLAQVCEDLDLDIQQKKALLHLPTLPIVNGYKRQLQQLFQNLISNSLKYSHQYKPAVITVTASRIVEKGQEYHLISVADNGIGFEQQYADKIFQMFTRLHGKGEYSGTGIGLSIVKKIIDNHRGIIRAESVPGEGATFKVWLPVG